LLVTVVAFPRPLATTRIVTAAAHRVTSHERAIGKFFKNVVMRKQQYSEAG